jgi:predicted amino acid dehydrogenase
MDTFAFIIHPIDPKRDVSRKFPVLGRVLNERQIDFFSTYFPPVYISEIEGITSAATGKQVTGWLIACPLTTRRMLELPVKTAYRKIIQTGRMAERLGANILGLGAFTSVVGDSGRTIARSLDIPVTTGDSYTVAVAIESVLQAARQLEIPLAGATAAIVGATGKIGSVCAEILAEQTGELILLGRRAYALEALRDQLMVNRPTAILRTSTRIKDLKDAQLILSVTSAVSTVIPADLPLPGSVICDVARPRDVSRQVAAQRQDVLVIDGGMVEIPGPANFNFDFGFPPGNAYACMAETIALALEGRFEAYTLGKQITRSQVEEIAVIAKRHGFRLGGFRSFERPVTEEMLARVAARTRHQPVFV